MAMPRDLCFTPAGELARLYRARKVSPLEMMQVLLKRIDLVNPRVNAIVTLDRAAALATGMCPLAEGTDLGGSLRGPAAYCGVVGFRTTPGLVPRYPDVLGWDSYSVEGPMARTISDTALMLSVMSGPADDRAPMSYESDPRALLAAVRRPTVKGWRVAWTPDLGGLLTVDPEIASLCEESAGVFAKLGARVQRASPDMSDVPEIVRLSRGFLMVARHADKLDQWKEKLQSGLEEKTVQGLARYARHIAR